MKRPSLVGSFAGLLFAWSCMATAQNPRPVLLASADSAPAGQRHLSEQVRRDVSRRLRPAPSGSSAVSLDLTWEWVQVGSYPGPWIDEPCVPQPSPDTPPVLTETCGKVRRTSSPRRTLVGTARIYARQCTTSVGPVRGSEKDAQRSLADGIAQAVAKLDLVATCQDAGWRP